jgi:menaquinone-dependent protoporphyrinogen oxidase
MSALVAYATCQGSTREIAERIAYRLSSSLDTVDCRSIENVSSINSYPAVIIGSAIHNGKWLSEASDFLQHNAASLSGRSVWAFSVGMVDGLPKWLRNKGRKEEEKKIYEDIKHHVQVCDHKLFSGVSQRNDMPPCLRFCWSCFGGQFGDLRDWDKIDLWSDMIAAELKNAPRLPRTAS